MNPHLEYMSADSPYRTLDSCEWEEGFIDFDGTRGYWQCGEHPEVWIVWTDVIMDDPDSWGESDSEIMSTAMCRPHGNLALIEMRQGY